MTFKSEGLNSFTDKFHQIMTREHLSRGMRVRYDKVHLDVLFFIFSFSQNQVVGQKTDVILKSSF